jgi:leucine dehydrogenase
MGYFECIEKNDHEQVVFCSDRQSGLRAIIGIHNTTLGPALGGCRMKRYQSEEEALNDVLSLSRAMTYKSAMAGLNLGGGKTVVMLDHPEQKTPELLTALAKRIDSLRGAYIGAGDIGSDTSDLKIMKETTRWVTGLSKEDGGLGDSAILTSLGVFMGMKAAVKEQFGSTDLTNIRVTMQGAGKVGYKLMEHLLQSGCQIWLSDVNENALKRVRQDFPIVNIVKPEELLTIEADIFSPNAVGGVITPTLAKTLPVGIVAGGANNVLSDESAGEILKERGILYAPDFVINSGGVIMVACEIEQLGFEVAQERTEALYNRMLDVFRVAKEENVTTQEAALLFAKRRIESAAGKKPLGGNEHKTERRFATIM